MGCAAASRGGRVEHKRATLGGEPSKDPRWRNSAAAPTSDGEAARVLDDLADRLLERPLDDLGTHLLVALDLQPVDGLAGAQQGHAAARYDTLLHRRAGRVERVLHPRLLLLDRRLGGGTDFDHRHAARQLRQALLQLLAVVVRSRLLDLRPDLLDPPLD